MPPQQTNIPSGLERDAAGPGLDLPIALAAVRLNASVAPPDGALSEGNPAGSMAASTRRIGIWFKRYWCAFQQRRQRLDSRAAVADLSDASLKDIGLTRDEIDYITPERAIDRLRENAHLWGRGAM
ncbi:MAG: DUF1127 domain-containing protein [Rhizobiales bacterium]|nr:DUF1127 domain-containing protein [Hyphomicrobiales bacterium]